MKYKHYGWEPEGGGCGDESLSYKKCLVQLDVMVQ